MPNSGIDSAKGAPVLGAPKHIVFDIETGPLSLPELTEAMPEFDPPGNIKDPAKIEKAIEEKKLKWIDKAALNAISGKLLAWGATYANEDKSETVIYHLELDEGERVTEEDLLVKFWDFYRAHSGNGAHWIGHNIKGFDIPFLMRRSFKYGLQIPGELLVNGIKWDKTIIDLNDVWACGDFKSFIKLDDMAKFLGCGEKTGSGKDFAKLFRTDLKEALSYLRNDLEITKKVWEKIGW